MITERTLKRWRKDSLRCLRLMPGQGQRDVIELHNRILRMTAELLDQHLIRKD